MPFEYFFCVLVCNGNWKGIGNEATAGRRGGPATAHRSGQAADAETAARIGCVFTPLPLAVRECVLIPMHVCPLPLRSPRFGQMDTEIRNGLGHGAGRPVREECLRPAPAHRSAAADAERLVQASAQQGCELRGFTQ